MLFFVSFKSTSKTVWYLICFHLYAYKWFFLSKRWGLLDQFTILTNVNVMNNLCSVWKLNRICIDIKESIPRWKNTCFTLGYARYVLFWVVWRPKNLLVNMIRWNFLHNTNMGISQTNGTMSEGELMLKSSMTYLGINIILYLNKGSKPTLSFNIFCNIYFKIVKGALAKW